MTLFGKPVTHVSEELLLGVVKPLIHRLYQLLEALTKAIGAELSGNESSAVHLLLEPVNDVPAEVENVPAVLLAVDGHYLGRSRRGRGPPVGGELHQRDVDLVSNGGNDRCLGIGDGANDRLLGEWEQILE